MIPLPQFLFDVFALSLPFGHGFRKAPPIEAWQSENTVAIAAITKSDVNGTFGALLMRRRTDQVWAVTADHQGLPTQNEARALAAADLARKNTLPTPRGIRPRPALYELSGREPNPMFNLSTQPSHHRAAWLLAQLYLALPNPDRNWVSDCQTANFHTRLWEAILLACFREQGLNVAQPYPSPDFKIENRLGGEAWIEAVTTNPETRFEHVGAFPTSPPHDLNERLLGPAALRFAKTLGNKLQKDYTLLKHVRGKPFAVAIADFHAPSSMVWSREALVSYLYGTIAESRLVNGVRVPFETKVDTLLGGSEFPCGLFNNAERVELSAVIFTNACTIGKLNRVAVSGGLNVSDVRYVRVGQFYDRRPGALDGIPFCYDIESATYRELWPQRYEPFSAELEVFHNPYAQNPLPISLLPEATHWIEEKGQVKCQSFYEHSILWSRTLVLNADELVPSYEEIPDFLDKLSRRERRQ